MSVAQPSRGGGGGGRRRSNTPPILAHYPNDPQYDLATIVQMVGVRPMILWGWEKQLGIPSPAHFRDEAGGVVRRYSERDLVATMWLRDQILNGATPAEAEMRLTAAQEEASLGGLEGNTFLHDEGDDTVRRSRVFTGPLSSRDFTPVRSAKKTRPLSENDLLGWAREPGTVDSSLSGLGGPSGQFGANVSYSGEWPALPQSRQQGDVGYVLGSGYSGNDGSLTGKDSGAATTPRRELRTLQPLLVRAFASLNTAAANHIVNEALGSYSIETVCAHLLQPTLQRVGEQWARREMTVPEERFALNYVRGFLFSVFHKTPERAEAPLVMITCGPREMNDVNALALAVFWRRAGLRVVFLGQDAEAESLVEEARKQRPAMVAVSVTTMQRVRSLARLAKQIHQIEAPRPIFAFAGPIFARNVDLQHKVGGVYLGDDAEAATLYARRLLGGGR